MASCCPSSPSTGTPAAWRACRKSSAAALRWPKTDRTSCKAPRLCAGRRRIGLHAKRPPGGGENAGSLQPRGEDRLGRDQGKDPRGFEAVYREGDLPAPADHARHPGGMNSGGSGAAADLTVRRSSAASMTRRYQSGPAHTDTCLTALTSSNKWYARPNHWPPSLAMND